MKIRIIISLLALILFSACNKNDSEINILQKKGDILICATLPNPDGMSGSAYMQVIENLNSNKYDNKMAFPVAYGFPPVIIGNNVFILPGWAMANNLIEKYTRTSNGELVKQGTINLPPQSGANSIVTTGNKAYVSLSKLGKILIIDYVNMTILGEIDISEYAIGDKNPDPAQMIIRDNILYIGLNQLVAGPTPNINRPKVDILLVNTKTDKALKMITEVKSGFSMPTKPEADAKSIFMDENKDIYINCISGFGMIGHKSGFLRIKNGETEFDKSYIFDITQTQIEGEKNKIDYIVSIDYKANGILYASGQCNAYFSKPHNYIEDRTVLALEIDIYNKSIKKLDLDNSNSFATSVSVCENLVIFGLATAKDKGFFIYNTSDKKVSPQAVIKLEGYPYCMRKF